MPRVRAYDKTTGQWVWQEGDVGSTQVTATQTHHMPETKYIRGRGRGNEGREARSQADILNAEMQQCKKYCHCLLLIPGEDQGQRQLIYTHLESVSESKRDFDR